MIQKRSHNRKKNPNKWLFTGGAVSAGESSLNSVIIEAREELGIDLYVDDLEFLLSFKKDNEIVDVRVAKYNGTVESLKSQQDEVS